MSRLVPAARYLAVVTGLLVLLVGCSNDGDDSVQSLATRIESGVQDASARAVAEAFAAAIDVDEAAAADGARSLTAIDENADDLPGDPEILYVTDSDGDGVDDDGRVGVRVGSEESCVELSPDSGEATVLESSC